MSYAKRLDRVGRFVRISSTIYFKKELIALNSSGLHVDMMRIPLHRSHAETVVISTSLLLDKDGQVANGAFG
jgi:hypothetical protein